MLTKLDKTFKTIFQALERVENGIEKMESGVINSKRSLQTRLSLKQFPSTVHISK